MTKDQLHDLASAGVALRVQGIERELAELHKGWPELFVSKTAPVLLAAAKKAATNGNGHWPPLLKTTPTATTKRKARKRPPRKRGELSNLVVATVARHPKGITVREVARAMHVPDTNLINVMLAGLVTRKRLRRVRKGVYAPA